MNETKITREEFERLWGYVPPGDAVGVRLAGASGAIVATYKFVGKTQDEIQELEKLAVLNDSEARLSGTEKGTK